MPLDQEQIRLLALAEQERDPQKLMQLIGEVLERFEDNADQRQLTQELREREHHC